MNGHDMYRSKIALVCSRSTVDPVRILVPHIQQWLPRRHESASLEADIPQRIQCGHSRVTIWSNWRLQRYHFWLGVVLRVAQCSKQICTPKQRHIKHPTVARIPAKTIKLPYWVVLARPASSSMLSPFNRKPLRGPENTASIPFPSAETAISKPGSWNGNRHHSFFHWHQD